MACLRFNSAPTELHSLSVTESQTKLISVGYWLSPFPYLTHTAAFCWTPLPQRGSEMKRKPHPELSALAALSCRAAACGAAPVEVAGWLQAKSITCDKAKETTKDKILSLNSTWVKASEPLSRSRIQPSGCKGIPKLYHLDPTSLHPSLLLGSISCS